MSGYLTKLDEADTLLGDEILELAQLSTTITITATTLSAAATDNSYNDSANGFVAAGFALGDRVKVAGFTGNVANNIYVGVISTLTTAKMVIASPEGDVIVDDAAGESVTITKWTTKRADVDTLGQAGSASTTDVLTGTSTAKRVTPDALAALWEAGADVASSGTISLGEGGTFNITGTTTITDIDLATDKAGRTVWVKFAGVLTLTHNASTLILPTGANITTAAGDTACFRSEGSDVVRCMAYQRASGAALASGGAPTESFVIACSDETTAIATGTGKVTFRMPYAFTVTAVRASVNTAPTGSTILIDINESGTTILSTKLMIDATEKTSTTAATPAVISDASLADDAEISVDFDQVGSTIAGAGVKVTLIGHQ